MSEWSKRAQERRPVKIGIIGGSGLEDPAILQNQYEKRVTTPFGAPSDALLCGTIEGVPCVILSRHGRDHSISPSNVNYRANLWALDAEKCTHVIATNACGSLQDSVRPGDLVFIDQFIDRTFLRKPSIFDGTKDAPEGVCHMPMAFPYCERTRRILIETALQLAIPHHDSGVLICVEGPRFSTRAESTLFRQWGGTVIGMTGVPEVCIAKELGLCYAAICLSTDYDCWHEAHGDVDVQMVMKTFEENKNKALDVIQHAVKSIAAQEWVDLWVENQTTVAQATMTKKKAK